MKKKVGILYGGKSGEHEISLLSGAAVLRALDKNKYIPVPIGIDKDGVWFIADGFDVELSEDKDNLIDKFAFLMEHGDWKTVSVPFDPGRLPEVADIVFPAVHGVNGEDGTLQGLMEMFGVPYAGCGVLASALCMDKAMAKEVFTENDIPVSRYFLVHAEDLSDNEAEIIDRSEKEFSYPVFVKPSNGGSSIGITKALNREELSEALKLAAEYDRRILIEEAIDAREIEVAVIGNKETKVATCGEIVAADDHRYYDYDAKYSDDSGTMLVIPADIPDAVMEEIMEIARRAYRATACEGFARVDTFWDRKTGRVLVNEINTIPGLTKYSLFPRLWEAVGVSFTDLIGEILELGYERRNY
ncbi:MAG: D-alanine--D-alanine ligase [Firmicutes bacterium]|nr:D-alanine--D-alanine ligase [Bacillota bacterium]